MREQHQITRELIEAFEQTAIAAGQNPTAALATLLRGGPSGVAVGCRLTAMLCCFERSSVSLRRYALTVTPHLHPPPVRSVAGNGEERAAQIDRIQARLRRLRKFSNHISAEIAAVTRDMEKLNESEPKPRHPKESH